jgi:hypothetical protein
MKFLFFCLERKGFGKPHISIVKWEDILTVKKTSLLPAYSLQRKKGESISLQFYQNIDELVSFIEQKCTGS